MERGGGASRGKKGRQPPDPFQRWKKQGHFEQKEKKKWKKFEKFGDRPRA